MKLQSLALLGSMLACATAAMASTCDRSALLVRNVDIWSPSGTARDRDVLVVDGYIREDGPTGQVRAPTGTRVVEGRDRIMLPGFVDAHVHFGYPGARSEKPDRHPWGNAAVTGRQLIASGVTSGRLHLDTLKYARLLHDASQDECAPLPRLQVSGPAFIPGSPTHDGRAVWSVTGVEDAVAKVRREKELGFEWIAIHAAHAFGDAEREAIVGTARQLGMRILGSGFSQEDVASSLALHPDTIDYIDVSNRPQYDRQLLELARQQKQLVWVARLGVHERYRALQERRDLIDAPLNYAFMEADEAEHLRTGIHKDIADRNSEHSRRMDGAYPTLRRKFEQLRATGLPLAAGTDAGSPGHFHRDSIWWELNAWLRHGASVDEALTAVTVNGAKVLADQRIGHLRPGARGDFLLYDGPLRGELSAQRVSAVAKSGVLYVNDAQWVGPNPP